MIDIDPEVEGPDVADPFDELVDENFDELI